MITVTLEGKTWEELSDLANEMFAPTTVSIQSGGTAVRKAGRAPKEKAVETAPTVEPAINELLTSPTPVPVATMEEASAALKLIVNTAGMGMPKASAIMEKVTGKKLFREVTPDQYGALVAACKEAVK